MQILWELKEFIYGAPTVLVVLADKKVATYRDNGNRVIRNLLNAEQGITKDKTYYFNKERVLR